MIKKRIIPCLDVKDGRVVKGIQFKGLRDLGNPVDYALYYNEQGADELVFLDISQTTKGHTLLVPKTHVSDIFAYDEALAGQVLARLPKVAKALEAAFDQMGGLNIINNNRSLAYQTVFHSHWHLIPRYQEKELDGFSMSFTNRMGQVPASDMQDLAQAIQAKIEEEA